MREIKGDMFDRVHEYDAICITTNGMIKKDGKAVMGAGIAKVCRDKYKGSDAALANLIERNGNIVQIFGKVGSTYIIAFPTKHNWRDNSSLELIAQSANQLEELIEKYKLTNVLLPRPGCTNGKLEWETVKSLIEPILSIGS